MTIFIENDAVSQLIKPRDVINSLDHAYKAFGRNENVCAPRLDFQSQENARGEAYQLGLAMGLGSEGYACVRIKSDMVFKTLVNGAPRKEKYCDAPGTYLGLLLVFDMANGALRAIVQDGVVQRMRVGADSALGVRYMARAEASTLGILGAGGMAATHIDAISTVRDLKSVRVYSPTQTNREQFAADARARLGIDVEAVDRPEDVYKGADILAACTNAIGPVVSGELLAPGMHVTCIGGTLDEVANRRVDRALRFGTAAGPLELDQWDFRDESLTFAVGGAKSGQGTARRYHDVPPERQLRFADLLADLSLGRSADTQITFSERGNIHGIQFAAVAGLIYERACEAGLGIDLGASFFLQNIRN